MGLAITVEISRLFKARLRLQRANSGSGLLASIIFEELAQ